MKPSINTFDKKILSMTLESEWPRIVRIVWITGGVVAINNPGPEVQIGAGVGGRLLGTFNLPTYPSLFAVLRQQSFPIVGATFIEDYEEAQGLRSPQFRALSDKNGWHAWNINQQWRDIAHASSKQDEMLLMDVASRIAAGLNYSEMRLLDLVEAYSIQLRGRLHKDTPKEYTRFKDTHSFSVYKAIHALFWEMAVLRDTLAEFAAKFCFGYQVSTLTGLIKQLNKNSNYSDPLAKQLLKETDLEASGWLAMFSEYRNLFTHSAPMEQVAGIVFAVQDKRILSPDLSIPQIYYPLPANVAELARRRSRGPLFETFKELVDATSGRRPERKTEPDALEYLHNCFDKLTELAALLITRSQSWYRKFGQAAKWRICYL